jgi:hypothetical protein
VHDTGVRDLRFPQGGKRPGQLLALPGFGVASDIDDKAVPDLPLRVRRKLLDGSGQNPSLSSRTHDTVH